MPLGGPRDVQSLLRATFVLKLSLLCRHTSRSNLQETANVNEHLSSHAQILCCLSRW